MLEPSLNLIPFAFVLLTASLPARSTKFNIEFLDFSTPPSFVLISILIQNTVWDLLDYSFWFVSAITLFSSPLSRYSRASSADLAYTSVKF